MESTQTLFSLTLTTFTLLFSCSSAKQPPAASNADISQHDDVKAETHAENATCEERAERLGQRLAKSTKKEGSWFHPPEGDFQGLRADGGTHPEEPGVRLSITQDGTVAIDWSLTEMASLTSKLREAQEALRSEMPENNPTQEIVYLWVDAKAPPAVLEKVLQDLPKGTQPRLMVLGKDPIQTRTDTETLANPRLVAIGTRFFSDRDPAERQKLIIDGLAHAIGYSCLPVAQFLSSVGGAEVWETRVVAAEELPSALVQCACNVTAPDLLEYIVYLWVGVFDPAPGWVPVSDLAKIRNSRD